MPDQTFIVDIDGAEVTAGQIAEGVEPVVEMLGGVVDVRDATEGQVLWLDAISADALKGAVPLIDLYVTLLRNGHPMLADMSDEDMDNLALAARALRVATEV